MAKKSEEGKIHGCFEVKNLSSASVKKTLEKIFSKYEKSQVPIAKRKWKNAGKLSGQGSVFSFSPSSSKNGFVRLSVHFSF